MIASENVITTVGSLLSMAVAKPVLLGDVSSEHPKLKLGGHVMTGGVLSWTTIVLLQVDILPQSSVPVQVRVVLYVPGQLPATVASMKVIVTLRSQASVVIGGRKIGVDGELIGVT